MPDRFLMLGANQLVSGVTADGTTATGMEASKLLTEEPSERCRVTSTTPKGTAFNLTMANPGSAQTDIVALINHDIPPAGTSKYRVVLRAASAPAAPTRLAPDAILAAANLTGAVTDIDEDVGAPDGLWLTAPTPTANTTLRVSFPTPASNPATGSQRQLFLVHVRNTGGTPTTAIDVFEGGAFRATIMAATAVSGSKTFWASWDASVLTDPTGAGVECRVSSVTDGVGTVEIGAVEWYAALTPGTAHTYDSGWTTLPTPTNQYGSYAAGQRESQRHLVHVLASPVTAAYGRLEIRTSRGLAPTSDGTWGVGITSFNAGVVWASQDWTPSRANFAEGSLVRVEDPSPGGYTLGGQWYGSVRRRRRVLTVGFPSLTQAEALAAFHQLDWLKGTSRAVLVVAFPDGSNDLRRHTSLFATVRDPSPLAIVKGLVDSGIRWSHGYTFAEKL